LKTVHEKDRESLVEEWIRIANRDLPYLFMSYSVEMVGINRRVRNFQPTAYSGWADQAERIVLVQEKNPLLSMD
jgi:ABC-type transport system substrate-binding protein